MIAKRLPKGFIYLFNRKDLSFFHFKEIMWMGTSYSESKLARSSTSKNLGSIDIKRAAEGYNIVIRLYGIKTDRFATPENHQQIKRSVIDSFEAWYNENLEKIQEAQLNKRVRLTIWLDTSTKLSHARISEFEPIFQD